MLSLWSPYSTAFVACSTHTLTSGIVMTMGERTILQYFSYVLQTLYCNCAVHCAHYTPHLDLACHTMKLKLNITRLSLRRLFSHRRKAIAEDEVPTVAGAPPTTPPEDHPQSRDLRHDDLRPRPEQHTLRRTTVRRKPPPRVMYVIDEVDEPPAQASTSSTLNPPLYHTQEPELESVASPPSDSDTPSSRPTSRARLIDTSNGRTFGRYSLPPVEYTLDPPSGRTTRSNTEDTATSIRIVTATAILSEAHYTYDGLTDSLCSSPALSYLTLPEVEGEKPGILPAVTAEGEVDLGATASEEFKLKETCDGIYTPVTTEGGCCGGNTPLGGTMALPCETLGVQSTAQAEKEESAVLEQPRCSPTAQNQVNELQIDSGSPTSSQTNITNDYPARDSRKGETKVESAPSLNTSSPLPRDGPYNKADASAATELTFPFAPSKSNTSGMPDTGFEVADPQTSKPLKPVFDINAQSEGTVLDKAGAHNRPPRSPERHKNLCGPSADTLTRGKLSRASNIPSGKLVFAPPELVAVDSLVDLIDHSALGVVPPSESLSSSTSYSRATAKHLVVGNPWLAASAKNSSPPPLPPKSARRNAQLSPPTAFTSNAEIVEEEE
ncbi:hypothetical protein BC629DRAFT_1005012 [Irpex lacteus]|nr:hypothetical protein BC629DRAFT_1005012 [Irpex lacteus]